MFTRRKVSLYRLVRAAEGAAILASAVIFVNPAAAQVGGAGGGQVGGAGGGQVGGAGGQADGARREKATPPQQGVAEHALTKQDLAAYRERTAMGKLSHILGGFPIVLP